ncbi:MAG: putative quinol monooxygenase [Paludibaculum sp.]
MSARRSWKCGLAIAVALICLAIRGPARGQSRPASGYAAIPRDAYSVVAEVHAKPGKADELRSATLPLVALVRSDPKNLVYFYQEDRSSPGHLVFYEVWANQVDFEAHNNMPYVKAWFAKLPALADGGVKTTRMRVLGEPAK